MMSETFRFIIRDGLASDVDACLDIDARYATEHVWRMSVQKISSGQQIIFQTERLPHAVDVTYPIDRERLQIALDDTHCFLVAVGRDEPDMLGYLLMSVHPLQKQASISDIVVSQPYRRHRVGTRLLQIARQWAQEKEAEHLYIEATTKNYPAIQFCQSSGFSFCGYNDQYFRKRDIAVFFGQSI